MKKILFFLLLPSLFFAQAPDLSKGWKIKIGDDMNWAKPDFDDSSWKSINPTTFYENQGYDGYNGFSWYRVKFNLPSSLRQNSVLKDSIRIIVGRVDDIDATYLNGVKIGSTGRFPEDPLGISGWYDKLRIYTLAANNPLIRWDADNTLAVRVYDGGGGGGLWGVTPDVNMVDVIDFVTLNTDAGGFDFSEKGFAKKMVKLENTFKDKVEGVLELKIQSIKGKAIIQSVPVKITNNEPFIYTFKFPNIENAKVTYTFEEKNTSKKIIASQQTPYILTPAEQSKPIITNTAAYGVRPNADFLWAIRATGIRPMTFSAKGLPSSLILDANTGVIKGISPSTIGEYEVLLRAKNNFGESQKKVKIIIGDKLALTPPMGWNSWNCWGMAVSQERVKSSADAIVNSGLINHGWTYVVIDDGWQGSLTNTKTTGVNEKFPDMKALSDDLHRKGLKFGIYSSPGKMSCGGLLTSYDHEREDAQQWAKWGVDYVKYDWCSYNDILGKKQNEWSIEEQVLPFRKMCDALNDTKRDILFSVCNWGMNDVWKWANQSGGQLWRTTGDIEDSWASLSTIGLSQPNLADYSKIGAWNDPDMLIVGWVGWGDKLHQTHLTPAEQYTHISMWAMLAAPMMIGCDISRLDAFTYNLLANAEINAINQDALGKVAKVVFKDADKQVWTKDLADGTKAVAIFNLKAENQKINITAESIGLKNTKKARNLWTQKDVKISKLLNNELLPHGCLVFKTKK